MQEQSALKGDKRIQLLEAYMRQHQFRSDSLLEVLNNAQELYGYLDHSILTYIADSLNLPLSHVYGVATFYHLFRIGKVGQHIINVCMGTACYVKGAEELISAVEQEFAVRRGETSVDGSISLFVTRCIGVCAVAPNVVVDGELLSRVSKDALIKQIKSRLEEGN